MKPKAPAHKRMKPSRKNPGHLDDIRRLKCLLSGRDAEACHVRYADAKHGKPITGMQTKPDDRYTVPLCPELHRLAKGCQHDGNERAFWEQFGIDPIKVALELYGQPRIRMERIIDAYRPLSYSPAGVRVAAILKGAK